VQRVGGWLAQGAGEHDGAVGLLGQFDEGGQAASETGDGAGGIQDEQAGVEAADHGGQVIQILGERERAGAGECMRGILDEGMEEQHMGGIASGGGEAWFDGLGGRVIGSEEDDGALLGGRAIRKWGAAGDAGSQGEGQEREAATGGGIEQGEVTKGDAAGPEPGEGLAGHVREEEDSGWEGSRGASRRGGCAWEGGGGGGEVEGAFEFVQEVVVDGFEGHGGGPFRGSEGG